MTMDSMWQLQKAIYDQLSGDAALGVLVNGIYDYVPEGSQSPYVVIGDMKSQGWYNLSSAGTEIDVVIETYDRNRGSKNSLEIMSRICTLLHNVALVLTGHNLVSIRFDSSSVIQEKDGLTYKGVARFKAVTQED